MVNSENTIVENKTTKEAKSPRLVKLRTAVLASGLVALAVSLVASSLMAILILVVSPKNKNKNLESHREVVSQEGEVIADVAQRVSPSVVSISTEQEVAQQDIFGSRKSGVSQSAGTGIIIDSEGLVITNKHVVPKGVSGVKVIMSDGTTYDDVKVIGRDPLNDLAFLKVQKPKDFQPAVLANSDDVRTGQKVIAIGNALGQFQNSVTEGIISGMGRPVNAGDRSGRNNEQLTNLFQTDAAINSGNSGGPLLNIRGEVIGINTAIAADAENIGFAIPINEAKSLIAGVKKTGSISRAYLGVRYISLTPALSRQLDIKSSEGAYVSTEADSVLSGSPADKAGLKPGDIITKINNIELSKKTTLSSAIGRFQVGDTVELQVVRETRKITLKAELAEAPEQ